MRAIYHYFPIFYVRFLANVELTCMTAKRDSRHAQHICYNRTGSEAFGATCLRAFLNPGWSVPGYILITTTASPRVYPSSVCYKFTNPWGRIRTGYNQDITLRHGVFRSLHLQSRDMNMYTTTLGEDLPYNYRLR